METTTKETKVDLYVYIYIRLAELNGMQYSTLYGSSVIDDCGCVGVVVEPVSSFATVIA